MPYGRSHQQSTRIHSEKYPASYAGCELDKKSPARQDQVGSRIRMEEQMKFTIPTKTLSEALRTISVCIGGKSTLPILATVKIEAEKELIAFSTTNLDIFATYKVEANVKKVGAACASFNLLSSLVNRMTSQEIAMEQKGKEIVFTSGEVTATFETLPADEFPPFPETIGTEIECDASEIVKPFGMLAHAMADQTSTRYTMQGINISLGDNGNGCFTATNAARLLNYSGIALPQEVTVPDQFVHALVKIAPEGPVKIGIGDGSISIKSDVLNLSSKLIEGSYPNWKNAIPEKLETAFSCQREEMIDALKTCMIFTDRQMPKIVIQGKGKEVEVSHPQGKAKAMLMGTELTNQPDFSIRMNARFLIESLSVMDCETVRLEAKKDRSAVMIEDGKLRIVINKLIDT